MAHSFPIASHDLQAEVNQLLRACGLPVVCARRVAANGDCFFDTVLALLEDAVIRQNIAFRAKNIHTIRDLRKALACFMRTDPKFRRMFAPNSTLEAQWVEVRDDPENKDLSWDQYLDAVANTRKYADQLVVVSMAMFIGKDIMVAAFPARHPFYRLMGPWEKSPGQPEGWEEAATTPPLIMANLRERHFEPLRDLPYTSVEQFCRGCGWRGKSLWGHLVHTPQPCKAFYNPDDLKKKLKEISIGSSNHQGPIRQITPPSPAQAAKRQDIKSTPTRQRQAAATTAPSAQPKLTTGKT